MRPLRFLSPLALFVAAPAFSGDLPFGPETPVLSGYDEPRDVIVGDLDHDGHLDLVAAAKGDGEVVALYGLGGGAFFPVSLTLPLDSPYTVDLGDLDRDGDADVVVSQYNAIPNEPPYPQPPDENEILWLRNPAVGGGAWASFAVAAPEKGARKAVVGDLQRDGYPDIVYALTDGSSGRISWARNYGDPESGFLGNQISGTMVEPLGLALADLDEDGDLDLVAADAGADRVVWFENVPGTLNFWPEEEIDADLRGACSVAVGDFDRDGIPDVVAAGGAEATLAWYEGAGATWPRHDVTTTFPGPAVVHAVDVDQDGDDDILGGDAGWVVWFENADGEGGSWIEREVDYFSPRGVAAGDLDQDGDLDVVGASWNADVVSWWENETIHRRFHAGDPLTIRSGLAEPRAVTVADLNGDGWLDVATALWEGDGIQACLAVQPATNTWWDDTVAAAGSFDGARAVTTADVDGDGALDVLGAAVPADDIAWWQNSGAWDPAWSRHTVHATLNGAHRTAPADFDRDGDVDLAIAGYDGDQVRLERNDDGLGTDWFDSLLRTINGPFDLKAGDLNRDGWPDLAVGGYDGNVLEVLLNDPLGTGDWDPVTVAAGVQGPRGIDLCDLDGDGALDLVALLRNTDQIRWYENGGDGDAWTSQMVGSGTFDDGAGVRCLDFDRDGDADIAAAGQAGDDVWVWFNDGAGLAWTRFQMDGDLDWAFEVDAGDLDRDGDLDLAVAAGGTSDALVWYENVGGQYGCTAYDSAPRVIEEGTAERVIDFIVVHHGRAGDTPLELSKLKFSFATATGTPLSSAQINQLATYAAIYQDTDRDAVFTPGADTLLGSYPTLTLLVGVWTVTLGGGPAHEVAATEAWRYFLVLEADPGAGPREPNHIVVSMPETECHARDRDHVLGLAGEPGTTVATDPVSFGANLFADAFETGDTSRWDAQVGG